MASAARAMASQVPCSAEQVGDQLAVGEQHNPCEQRQHVGQCRGIAGELTQERLPCSAAVSRSLTQHQRCRVPSAAKGAAGSVHHDEDPHFGVAAVAAW